MGDFDDILGAAGKAPAAPAAGGRDFDHILGAPAVNPPPVNRGNPIDRTIRHGVTQGLRNVGDFMGWATQNPLARGVGAVLGTTERAGESGTSWALDKLAGKKPRTNPIKGVLDPEGDPRVTHRLERQWADWADQHIPGMREARAHNATLPQADAGLRSAINDFQTQTLHDPATYVPGLDIFSILGRAARFARAGQGVRRAAGAVGETLGAYGMRGAEGASHPVNEAAARLNEHLKSNLTTSHDPLKGVQQSGLNITRSHEGGARHLQAKRETEYAPVPDRQATLRQLGDTLHAHGLTGKDITSKNVTPRNALGLQNPVGLNNVLQGVPQSFPRGGSEAAKALRGTRPAVPEPLIPLHQRLALHKANKLTDAALWREGSPQARAQMRARGYQPSAEDAALPNANLVQGDYGRRYIPEQSIQDKTVADEAARGFSISKGGVKRSKFDAPKHGGPQNLAPLDERFANRLQSSAYLEPKRRAEQNIIRDLGLTPTQVGRTDARITDLKERLALTPKGTPEHDLLSKHVGKYQSLHQRQTAAAYKDALLREKHLNPLASVGDQKHEALRQQLAQTPLDHPDREALEKAVAAHENPLEGILRGKKTAEKIAARDVAFHGGDTSAAFNEKGKMQGRLSTGASGEKYRQRLLAATGAESRKTATQAALRDLDERLSKMGLKQQKKVTKKIGDLRTKQAMRERTNLASLEKHATPKVRAAPETPNIFDLPHLSNRKLTHELPKSSPVMKRIATLRDERERRGGAEFAPLLHALPTDTTKATGKVHRLADRAARDAALKHSALDTAAKAHKPRLEQNKAVSKIEKGVGADPLYQGQVGMPSPLHNRLFGPKVHTEPGIGQGVGRAIKSAMFTVPTPHLIGNVFEQQVFAGGGLGTLARGAVESAKLARKDPAALARMNFTKQHGAIHEHGFEHRVPQWNPASRWLNQGLTLGHEGQASALMDKYIKDGLSPADAAEEVRKTFGRPHEQAKEVKKGEAAGGLFWNWLLGTVPRSAKKMMGSAKSRNGLKNFARVDEDANADVFEPEYGVEWNPGGFASRAASLAIRPASYFGGASMDTALHETATAGKHSAWDAAKGYVPFLGLSNLAPGSQVLTDAQRARGGYKKLPEWAKAMTLGGSYYTRAETPHAKRMRELKREGLMQSRP